MDQNLQELVSRVPKWQRQTEVRSNFERETSADSLSSEQKEQVPFAHTRSSHWKMQELNQTDSSSPLLQQVVTHSVIGPTSGGVSSFGFPTTSVSAPVGSLGRHPSPGQSVINQRPPSPSLSKRDPRQNLVDKDHMRSYPVVRADPRIGSFSGQSNSGVRDKHIQDLSRNQNLNMQKLPPQTLQKPPSPTFHQRHHVPSSEQLPNSKTELSDIVDKAQQLLGSSLNNDTSSNSLNSVASKVQGQSNVSSLLAAVMKSGLLSGSSVSGQVDVRPSPATTIPPPSIRTSSKDATTLSGPRDSIATASESKLEKSPLVPPVASSPTNASAQTPNANPLSILSTLISKGLISAPKSEAAASVPVKSEDQVQGQSSTIASVTTDATVTTGAGSSVSKVYEDLPEPSTEKISSCGTGGKKSDSVPSTKEVEDLIGFEFRPRVLRDLHPAVIDRLSDNLPHRCAVCGVRFKLQERLARHSQWHAFKNSILKCLNEPARRWYSNSADWIAGKAGFPFGYNSTCLTEGSSKMREDKEKIVPADESQCVCLICGELFEDFYSQEKDEWMFRGAVYLSTSSGSTEVEGSCSEGGLQNLIVHASCISGDSGRDLGLIRGIKVEKDT